MPKPVNESGAVADVRPVDANVAVQLSAFGFVKVIDAVPLVALVVCGVFEVMRPVQSVVAPIARAVNTTLPPAS